MNILITSASRKVSLIRAFQKALAHNSNGKVIAVDMNPLSPALYFADDYYIIPPTKGKDFLDIILDMCKTLDIKLLVPTRDEELLLFAENRDKFLGINTHVMVSNPKTIEICHDKELFENFCKKNNFKTPKTYQDIYEFSKIKFPVFIKPKIGKGGIQTFQVNSEEELKVILNFVQKPIIQEFIDSIEYTVDLFADFNGNVISVVPRKRIKILGGESITTKTVKNSVIINEVSRLADRLNLIGHNTIQCFLDDGEVKFIEVNPRFGGAASLSFAAGAHSPSFLIKIIEGEELKPMIGEFKEGYIALRYIEDTFIEDDFIEERRYK